MSKFSSKVILPAALLTIMGGIALATTSPVSANYGGDGQTTLMQRLVSRFNLNESEVQTVFAEVRTERQAEREKALELRLTEAVAAGKLTEAQKQLVLAKHEELQATREANLTAWQALTPEEKRAQMTEQRQALQDWAKANGIDTSFLFMADGPMMGRGMKGGARHMAQ